MPELNPEMTQMATDYGVKIVGALLLLVVSFLVAAWARSVSRKGFEKARLDATLSKFFSNMVRYLVLIAALLGVLGIFGIETTSFAAILGAAGLAVGLSLQGSLSNFSNGVMLLTFRPFKVGDVVTAGGHTGKVDEIELFTTRLVTPDNRLLILPNSAVFGGTIENITAHDTRRVDVAVGIAYDADIDKARQILEKVATTVEGGLSEPAPQVYLADLGASSVDWAIRVWSKTDDYWAVRERIVRETKLALDQAGIGIPFPQMDVHFSPSLTQAIQNSVGKVA